MCELFGKYFISLLPLPPVRKRRDLLWKGRLLNSQMSQFFQVMSHAPKVEEILFFQRWRDTIVLASRQFLSINIHFICVFCFFRATHRKNSTANKKGDEGESITRNTWFRTFWSM
ncbi:Uncharacterized protein APZ42_016741 [Daphnia magna]|uniref:Uncharacterized protein n=1 Tax=Daphnia magna TaxID=35525 RepID=A0A165A451_9CRUS|nr:Uncharacterized protein APZ42_016741 [Daphnia magna]